ncbi:gliding motility lipoprotein GldH [Hymenobacter rubripertinctus]|uniref:Gliding motility lipoprotein GldH n=1 Tax=Hymenobacter rubripertinctus TaxID=2029981 RepID=A0A418R351_9BACT|nr:gliding motility lipoprotein GldH [Hymenobacter rubripertinctus]RIY11853.1 gliding motility lipoprotein GldH [Hymenobacter rubripertinctus]
MNYKLLRALPVLALLTLAACDPAEVYEKNTDLTSPAGDPYVWAVQEKPAFEFEIPDTTQAYDVYLNVRNVADYGYYNLYVRATLTGPDNRVLSRKLHEMTLMDPKTGEPRGDGSGDIFDHRFLALPGQQFPVAGTYKVVLEQYMRQDQLRGIMAVGVRVARHPASN